VCFIEEIGSIVLLSYGCHKDDSFLTYVGLLAYLLFPIANDILLNIWACVVCCDEAPQKIIDRFAKMNDIIPIVYSPGYNITACGFEKMHPFDSTKYRRIWDFLHDQGTIDVDKQKFF